MKRLDQFCITLIGVVLIIALTGCAPTVLPPSPEDIQTALAETLTAEPQPTEEIAATEKPTNTPAPSPTAFKTTTPTLSPPISGSISAAYLNLRAGPSTFFEIIQTFVEGTAVTALSRTPDSKWVKVEIEFEDDPTIEGWMAVLFLEMNGEIDALPTEDFGPERSIQGRVEDTEGNPIPNINIAFILNNDQVDLRSDATSDEDGIFTVYLPEDLFGTFDVQTVSWNCESPIADANCQLSGFIELEDRIFITTPQEEEILFRYEATDQVLTGTVVDANDDPVEQVLVVAERDDGATSLGRSDALGEFSIPIAAGTWDVYTVIYDPDYIEGERFPIEVTDSDPDSIVISYPE
jgi:hypothetical protein